MSYMQDAVQILRILIGDDESPYTYCEDRLENMIIGCAKMVNFELSFDIDYTIDLATLTISPDPSTDKFFLPLVCLYAAMKIANSEYKVQASSAISITDGPSNINMGSVASSYKARVDALTKDWQNAKMQYSIGNAIGCHAILSTCESIYSECYIGGYFNPNYYHLNCSY